MTVKRRYAPDPGTGLQRAASTMRPVAVAARDRSPHDPLHDGSASGHCYCLCPKCWVWLLARSRGVCICFDCACGGATWVPRGIVQVTT